MLAKIGIPEILHRRQMNFKKVPTFRRQEYFRFKRLRTMGWRRPRGMHSKLRLQRDNRRVVNIGYGTDKRVRFMVASLKKFPIMIQDLYSVINRDWKSNEYAIIRSQVSERKRIGIRAALQARAITCFN